MLAIAVGVVIGRWFPAIRRRREEGGLYDHIPDAVLVIEHGAVTEANAAALQQFGYAREHLIGLPVRNLLVDRADEKRFVTALIHGPTITPAPVGSSTCGAA